MHGKVHLSSSVTRKIKIKTLKRYHYTSVRMVKIKEAETPKGETVEKLELSCIFARNVNSSITLDNWQILTEVNIYRAHNPDMPPLLLAPEI